MCCLSMFAGWNSTEDGHGEVPTAIRCVERADRGRVGQALGVADDVV